MDSLQMLVKPTQDDDKELFEPIKPFHETYRLTAMTMVFGMFYPHPPTNRIRFWGIMTITIIFIPFLLLSLHDIIRFWLDGDIINMIRIIIITGPFMSSFIKMGLFYCKRSEAKLVMDEINDDFELCNRLPQQYSLVVREAIASGRKFIVIWNTVVILATFLFPIRAAFLSAYEYLVKGVYQRYMFNDLSNPFRPYEQRFDSPYFEIITAYTTFCGVVYMIQYIGFEGFMVISMNHVCTKMKLFCVALEDAFRTEDSATRMKIVISSIKEQNRTFLYFDAIRNIFEMWNSIMSGALIVEFCILMYYFSQGYGIDARYVAYTIAVILYMYILCHFAGKIKNVAADIPTLIYSSGWENIYDKSVRKMLVFMISRWQVPLTMTIFNIMDFDMELFVFISKSAYSFFTLIHAN